MSPNVEAVLMLSVLTVNLTVKLGLDRERCRTNCGRREYILDVREGIEVFVTKTKQYASQVAEQYTRQSHKTGKKVAILVPVELPIYNKTSTNARQRDYVVLSAGAVRDQLASAWNSALLRTNGQVDFKLETFVYLDRQAQAA